jgi:hypothetical protein
MGGYMKGATIRKWHRRMGIWLLLLILVQASTGLVLTLEKRSEVHRHAHAKAVSSDVEQGRNGEAETAVKEEGHGLVGVIHHSGGVVGVAYRLIVGFGIIGMALSGGVMFFRLNFRKKN